MTALAAIVARLGGTLYDQGRRALIPGPGHSAHDRSVSLAMTHEGRVLIHCFSPCDDWRVVRDHLRAHGLVDAHRPAPSGMPLAPPSTSRRNALRRLRALRIWNESRPLAGTIGERYLRRRGVTRDLATSALRFHPGATSLEDRLRRPALLAAITNLAGALQGVQITLLSAQGEKAALAVPRRVVGAMLGGWVQLDMPRDGALVVAEGVETALSAAQIFDRPAWALLSAWNLAHFVCPPDVQRLLIAADNGRAGHDAATALQGSVHAVGQDRVATILAPPTAYGDWNDVVRADGRI